MRETNSDESQCSVSLAGLTGVQCKNVIIIKTMRASDPCAVVEPTRFLFPLINSGMVFFFFKFSFRTQKVFSNLIYV